MPKISQNTNIQEIFLPLRLPGTGKWFINSYFLLNIGKICYNMHRNGYAILMSILIIGAIGVSIIFSLLLTSLNLSQSGLTTTEASRLYSLALACAEEGLQVANENENFLQISDQLSFDSGECQFSYTDLEDSQFAINSWSQNQYSAQKIKTIFTIQSSTINLISKIRVSDF